MYDYLRLGDQECLADETTGDHAHATCFVWAYCVKTGKKIMVSGVFTIGILSQFRKEFEGDSCNTLHRQTVFTDLVSA